MVIEDRPSPHSTDDAVHRGVFGDATQTGIATTAQTLEALTSGDAARLAAQQMGDPGFAESLRALSPSEIAQFVTAWTEIVRRRRLMLLGYLTALMCILLGLAWAVVVYVTRERGTFVSWVFLVPFTLAAISLWLFGHLANRIKTR